VTEVRRLTGGRGVQAVYDGVGRTTFEGSLSCLLPRQKGSLFLTRPSLVHYIATREELLQRAGDVLTWIRDGTLNLRMELEYPLERAADAQRALEGRRTTGKVLLIP
jgi:NADPH2:quinone reductase